MESANGPILIGGADRSGPGLLGEVLERHESLAVSRRTNLWSFYLNRYGDLSKRENLERCLDAMLSYTRVRAMHPDRESLAAEFIAGEDHSYFRLFRILGRQFVSKSGRSRWVDKSLNSERDAVRVLEAYPDAVMIHVIRDPRDRHASMVHHRGGRRSGVFGSIAVWRHSARLAERNAKRFRGRYLVVRYEDLVTDPEPKMREVCEFIGEPFDPHMVTSGHEGATETRLEFSTSSIGRYRVDVPARDVALMERVLDAEMQRFGYPKADERSLSLGRRLLLETFGRAATAVFLLMWRPWSGFKRRFVSAPSRRRTVPNG